MGLPHLLIDAPDDAPFTIALAHGAGAAMDSPFMQAFAAGLAARGLRCVRFEFPYMATRRVDGKKRPPDRAPVLIDTWRAVIAHLNHGSLVIGGKSMGGRIASQVAARGGFAPVPAGLVFFGYPLHPPGKPDMRRDRHLPDITVPMLFIHGTKDPFGTREEMRELIDELPTSTLTLVDGGDHSLVTGRGKPVSGDLLDGVRRWMR